MTAFRVWLATIFVALAIYTAMVVANFGWNLFAVFIGDMARMEWPGQFNLDFLFLLTLSGLWTAWRNAFTPVGIVLALLATFGGALFMSVYLLFLTFQANGDIREVLLGKSRG
ncbi:MAG: hypothetical protein ABL973_04100 [Micropepsaceae bacterium]